MKLRTRFLGVLLAVSMLATATFAQNPLRPSAGGNFSGLFNASAYASWSTVSSVQGSTTFGPGAASFTVADSNFNTNGLAGGSKFYPFQVGVRILVDVGSSSESVTLTGVTGCNGSLNLTSCTLTGTFANAHQGSGVRVASASFGLDEAYVDAFQVMGGGRVLLDASYAGTTATITAMPASLLNGKVVVEDIRAVSPVYYFARPTAVTLIAAPAAPTITIGTGSLSSGAYRAMVAYVDCEGGVSLASTDSTQSATTTSVTVSSPAAATGACGYLPYITAAGGGTGTEILGIAQNSLSTICPLSTLTVVPSCAIGSAATITAANPSATSKPVVEGFALSTFGLVAHNAPPQPFPTSYPFGIFVATATLNASNADAAQTLVPAGYFNRFGGSWDLCVKAATATQVASSTLTINITASNNYAQSPVTVSTIAFPTQTQAAAGTAEGCVTLHTSTTGASGKFWAGTPSGPWHNFLSSAPATQVVSADGSVAASSAIDLTKQIWLSVNLQAASANNITGPIVNSFTIRPTPGT